MPALELDVAFIHMNRADARGNGQFLGPDLYFDDLFCMAAKRRFMTVREDRRDVRRSRRRARSTRCASTARMVDGVIEAPGGAHFTECPPDYGRDEAFQSEYAATAKDDGGLAGVQGALPRRVGGRVPEGGAGARARRHGRERLTRAEICAVAVAEAFRGDGEILASSLRHRARRSARGSPS